MDKNIAYRKIMEGLSRKNYARVYWLEGEESFFIDEISKRLSEEVLEPSARSFNEQVVYGKDANLLEILNQARQFPVASPKRLVLVREAQQLPDLSKKAYQQALIRYVEKPVPFTVLVFCYKGGRAPKILAQSLQTHAAFLRTKKLYDEQVIRWITDRAKQQGLLLSKKAVLMLFEHVGQSLHALANALDVLAIHWVAGEVIDDEKVQYYTGFSKEYNIFELQRAIGNFNMPKMYKIIDHMVHNVKGYPPQRIVYGLFDYFYKVLLCSAYAQKSNKHVADILGINPYFLSEYRQVANRYSTARIARCVLALQQADVALKGMGASTSAVVIVKELLYRLFGALGTQ